MNKKLIRFSSVHPYFPIPKPAKTHVPDWYKDASRFYGLDKPVIDNNGLINRALKLCMPFLDSLTTGYIVELCQDVQVTQNPFNAKWHTSPNVIHALDERVAHTIPVPPGHLNKSLVWWNHNLVRTPKGYSSLITHPFNRFDLPFTTLSGVVDTDGIQDPTGAIPFYIKEDFEGIIPAGTPIYQIMPFKRDDWESKEDPTLAEEAKKEEIISKRITHGWYKRHSWKRKSFN